MYPILDHGIRGKVDFVMTACSDLSKPGREKMNENGCVQNSEAFDIEQWGEILNSEFVAFKGVTCGCMDDTCNEPKREYLNHSKRNKTLHSNL